MGAATAVTDEAGTRDIRAVVLGTGGAGVTADREGIPIHARRDARG